MGRSGDVLDRLGGISGRLEHVLEASWGRLGGVLGRLVVSWERLRSSWKHLGKNLELSWVVLGRLGSVVEASWRHLGLSYRHIGSVITSFS